MVDMDKTGKRAFGTHYIAGLCQVTRQTVARWIEEGKLPAFNTAGGQKRVWDKDLAAFLKMHNIPLPERLAALAGLKVLVVDDEANIRRLVARIIQASYPGAEVLAAGDGFEAGTMTAAHSPSLVVLDVQLPGLDGAKVCRNIRADERRRNTRILAMSGRNPEEARRDLLEAGADGFVGKPFSVEEFRAKLAEIGWPDGGPR
ncbi:MAG: response regulator with CheY-like receiver domain and winged-helix DNA-binding domain [Elusimicrobia bacterium]|nr:MAG: response regulator with CheY-like receiver domain and winged-helix DNA-binding domain [Elusimicrobiota bacterium]